jgi:hypothetical protein
MKMYDDGYQEETWFGLLLLQDIDKKSIGLLLFFWMTTEKRKGTLQKKKMRGRGAKQRGKLANVCSMGVW